MDRTRCLFAALAAALSPWAGGCAAPTRATGAPHLSAPSPEQTALRAVAIAAGAPAETWRAAVGLARAAADREVPAVVIVTDTGRACPPRAALDRLDAARVSLVPPEVASDCAAAEGPPPPAPGPGLLRVDRLGRVRRLLPDPHAAPEDLASNELVAFDVLVSPARLEAGLAPWFDADPATVPWAIALAAAPLEAAGPRGTGGVRGDATIRFAPAPLRRAYLEGRLAGVVAGGEPDLSITADLAPATMRADRRAPPHPVFQVVVPSGERPRPGHRLLRARSLALAPDVLSFGPGVVVLDLQADGLTITAVTDFDPMRGASVAAPFPPEATGPRDFGSMLPCPRCAPVPADARP